MKQEELIITADDGARIKAVLFSPPAVCRAVVIGCHGFGEHHRMYSGLVDFFTMNGFGCVFFDQRGHGEMAPASAAERKKLRGVIPDYETLLDDITAVRERIRELDPELPLILFGHSMGGNIALNYLLKRTSADFCGAVIETPWLRLHSPQPRIIEGLAQILGKLNGRLAITNSLNLNDITRDESQVKALVDDELYHNRISIRLFSAVTAAGEEAIKDASKLSIPVFLACALEDKIVSPEAIKEFAARAGSNVELMVYEDAYHAIHSDLEEDRKKYLDDVLDFLNQVVVTG